MSEQEMLVEQTDFSAQSYSRTPVERIPSSFKLVAIVQALTNLFS